MAVKFPLKMADGAAVRTLEDLREHFDLTTVLSYYDNGRLVKWLENGYYDEEAGKVAALDAASADFAKELCAVLGVECPGDDPEAVDLGRISSRNERLNRLKQYTADDTILAAVDRVAFTQEDLADLLGKGITDVYLYGERFVVPEGFENISIQCVNNPTVTFSKVERLEQAAKQGDTKAQAELARYYQERNNIDSAVEWYVKAVAAGDTEAVAVFGEFDGNPEAQMKIGDCYFHGTGVEEDVAEALKWYKLAAEQGYAPAQVKVGNCYSSGYSTDEDDDDEDFDCDEEAVKWYNLAAEHGCVEAQFELAECYFNGTGVEEDEAEALKWYKLAAERGYAPAQVQMGDCYLDGSGVEEDPEEAVKWLKLAAEQGDALACHKLTNYYVNGSGVEEEAVEWYKQAAEQGFAPAQIALGQCYLNGKGVEQDYEEAAKWCELAMERDHDNDYLARPILYFLNAYKKATKLNDAEAQTRLGQSYLHGIEVNVDRDEAIKWFRMAAKQGNIEAQKALCACDDFDKWYQRATSQGDIEAQMKLAECYLRGRGIRTISAEAVKWCLEPAEQGYVQAQTMLLECCIYAQSGLRDEEGVKWCEKAAAQGYVEAFIQLAEYYGGNGFDEDASLKWYAKAAEQCRASAEQGDAPAQVKMGDCYAGGYRTDEDAEDDDFDGDKEALKWYRLAAEQGFAPAQRRLGQLYWRDNDEAAKWFKLAAEQGDAEAQCELTRLLARMYLS